MAPDKYIVGFSGILSILFIYWFFFGKKERGVEVKGKITITVDGGYNPPTVVVKNGAKTTLTFIRKDTSSCLEEIVLPEFKIRKYLPLNTPIDIEIIPKRQGEFPYSCGMNMYFGKISVI
jgi:plastocyanin domain-containing protein